MDPLNTILYINFAHPAEFQVKKFCKMTNISRKTYYQKVAPLLHRINLIRERRGLPRIPSPGEFRYTRFLKNQQDNFYQREEQALTQQERKQFFNRSPGRPRSTNQQHPQLYHP